MSKKILAILVAILVLVSCHLVEAQQPKKIPRIGILRTGSAPDPFVEAFRQGLRDLGYVEGQNIIIEYRYSESNWSF